LPAHPPSNRQKNERRIRIPGRTDKSTGRGGRRERRKVNSRSGTNTGGVTWFVEPGSPCGSNTTYNPTAFPRPLDFFGFYWSPRGPASPLWSTLAGRNGVGRPASTKPHPAADHQTGQTWDGTADERRGYRMSKQLLSAAERGSRASGRGCGLRERVGSLLSQGGSGHAGTPGKRGAAAVGTFAPFFYARELRRGFRSTVRRASGRKGACGGQNGGCCDSPGFFCGGRGARQSRRARWNNGPRRR